MVRIQWHQYDTCDRPTGTWCDNKDSAIRWDRQWDTVLLQNRVKNERVVVKLLTRRDTQRALGGVHRQTQRADHSSTDCLANQLDEIPSTVL